MKKLLALLIAFLPGFAKAADTKLGSEGDLIRQMLFASQSLKEQVARAQLDGISGPFQSIADSSKLVDAGKKEEAIALLRSILDAPRLETRIQLWVWSALRELGQVPDPKFAYEVLGAVIEFPSGGGYDTLAGYVDGSARYLNFSGAAIFWDAEDPTIKAMCQSLVDSTIPASSRAKPRTSLALPNGTPQVTMLTRSGPFVIVSPPDSVIGPGAALMVELMKRAKEKKGEPDGTANAGAAPSAADLRRWAETMSAEDYQVVFEFSGDSPKEFDRFLTFEARLEEKLRSGIVDGHDIGGGVVNLFVFTSTPDECVEEVFGSIAPAKLPYLQLRIESEVKKSMLESGQRMILHHFF